MSHIILHKEPSSRYVYSRILSTPVHIVPPTPPLTRVFVRWHNQVVPLVPVFPHVKPLVSVKPYFPHQPRRLQILLLCPPWTLIFPLPFVTISALALIILTLFPLIICLPLKHFLFQSHLLLFPSYTRKLSLTLAGVRQWAMEVEMHALKLNHTWDLIPKPAGIVDCLKAHLVAEGFTQTYGLDYTETFSSFAKLNSIHIIISLAANLDWPLDQLDFKNAFLHGDLTKIVYMAP